jgi:hypothetical protein
LSPFATHQPLLFACAARARGPVIELGAGLHSTPQLAAMCADFRSYETDAEWASGLVGLCRGVTHVNSYDDVPVKPYGLVFIDNAPEERRKIDLARFAESRLVVVHDTDPQYGDLYGLEESLALYPYRFDYRKISPHTTVVSRDAVAVDEIRRVFE